jgi:hypothetical protein
VEIKAFSIFRGNHHQFRKFNVDVVTIQNFTADKNQFSEVPKEKKFFD